MTFNLNLELVTYNLNQNLNLNFNPHQYQHQLRDQDMPHQYCISPSFHVRYFWGCQVFGGTHPLTLGGPQSKGQSNLLYSNSFQRAPWLSPGGRE